MGKPGPDVSALARATGIPYSTLAERLKKNGNNVALAISAPRLSPAQCGKLGARRSPWRYPADTPQACINRTTVAR